MISPQPDIRKVTIDPEHDSWMILACDGIWNSMSSQEVVDYVNQKIDSTPQDKLSLICEEVGIIVNISHTLDSFLIINDQISMFSSLVNNYYHFSCLRNAWPLIPLEMVQAVIT